MKPSFSNSSILKAGNFLDKNLDTSQKNENYFNCFGDEYKNKIFLLKANIELQNTHLFEKYGEEKMNLEYDYLSILKEDYEKLKNFDYSSIFSKQPTQLNVLNNKINRSIEMDNLMEFNDVQPHPELGAKIENDIQLLSRKRKSSEGLTELKKEILDK